MDFMWVLVVAQMTDTHMVSVSTCLGLNLVSSGNKPWTSTQAMDTLEAAQATDTNTMSSGSLAHGHPTWLPAAAQSMDTHMDGNMVGLT